MPKRESVLTPIVDVPILLTRQQAAELANVSTDCLDNWSHRPNFPVIRDGQLVRIHRDLFDQWLRTQAIATNARAEVPQPSPEPARARRLTQEPQPTRTQNAQTKGSSFGR
jgi:excisionase family DNA binding protein